QLLLLVNQGYKLHAKLWEDYKQKKDAGTFVEEVDRQTHLADINAWTTQVVAALRGVFPSEREEFMFHHPDQPSFRTVVEPDYQWKCTALWLMDLVKGLDKIRQSAIPEYTDLPIAQRLHVEDIDSFHKVRDVNPDAVASFLKNGYLDWPEDKIQSAL